MANKIGEFIAAFAVGFFESLLEVDDDNRPRLSVHEDDGMTDAIYEDEFGNEYTRDCTGKLKGWDDTPP